jgi:hypothetical protein
MAREQVISACLEVVSKRSLIAIGALFELVRVLDRRRRPANDQPFECPACARRKLSATPTLRVLSDEASSDDEVLKALRQVHHLRDREHVVRLLEPWLWRGGEDVRLAVLEVLGRYLDLKRTARILALPALQVTSSLLNRGIEFSADTIAGVAWPLPNDGHGGSK